MFTINGCGTKLYGRTPTQDGKGYIATEWICALWLPLVPLKSYIVLEEKRGTNLIWGNNEYELAPLPSLYRPHLQAYFVTIGVVLALWLAGTYWSTQEEQSDKVWREAEAANERAFDLKETGDPAGALAEHRRARMLLPEQAVLWFNEGLMLYEMDSLEAAEQAFTEALSRNKADTQSYRHRALVYEARKKYYQAVADLEAAAVLDPGNAELMILLSQLNRRRGTYDEAIAWANKALAVNGESADAYLARANAEYLADDLVSGLLDAKKAIALDSTAADGYFQVGLIRQEQGRIEEAKQAFGEFIRLTMADEARAEDIKFVTERLIELRGK